jgi:uncharacterized protein
LPHVFNLKPKMKISIPENKITEFCHKWQINELSLFGSVLRDDFRPDSDIDFLVSFSPQSHHSLFDLVRMQDELKNIFGREVDLVSRQGLESSKNYLRKNAILNSLKTIYAA